MYHHSGEPPDRPFSMIDFPRRGPSSTQTNRFKSSQIAGGEHFSHVPPVHARIDDRAWRCIRSGKIERSRQEPGEFLPGHLARRLPRGGARREMLERGADGRLLSAALDRRRPLHLDQGAPSHIVFDWLGYPFDQAGQGEASLLLALLRSRQVAYRRGRMVFRSAREASVELGIKGRDRVLGRLRKALGVERANAHGARN